MKLDEVLCITRNESGRSQEYMALELGVARRTIQNWEAGVSEPNVSQFLNWFSVLNRNPIPYILQFVYPSMDHISANDDISRLRKSLVQLVAQLPDEGVRQLLYLFYGDHGSSPRAIMQLVTAHLQTPMNDRVTQAKIITHNYTMANKKGVLNRPDHIQPDLNYLNAAIEAGEHAYLHDAKEYLIKPPHEN